MVVRACWWAAHRCRQDRRASSPVFLASGHRAQGAFYTTPLKALSNQKYADLVRRHGADKVGLLTGDNAINGEAPIVVMTTEVLRNMMYAGSATLRGLGFVVMDEVHYLADGGRGAVWEEVIIHLPEDVQVVSLSATVSNAEEFGAWLGEVRGNTEVIVEEHRPVPPCRSTWMGRTGQRMTSSRTDRGWAWRSGTRPRSTLSCSCGSEVVTGLAATTVPDAPRRWWCRGRAPSRWRRGRARSRWRRGGAPSWRRPNAGDVTAQFPQGGFFADGRPEPFRGHIAPRPRRAVAGDHLHLQPHLSRTLSSESDAVQRQMN